MSSLESDSGKLNDRSLSSPFPSDAVSLLTLAGQTPAPKSGGGKKGKRGGGSAAPRAKTNQDWASGCSFPFGGSSQPPTALLIVCDGHGSNGDQVRCTRFQLATCRCYLPRAACH